MPAHILLVEDDLFLRELYAQALESSGFKVTAVADAQAALDALDSRPADAIVLDVFLPVNNAFAVIQQLQSYGDWQALPVILISSHRLTRQQLPAKLKRQLSVVDFLYKPDILPDGVVSSVKAALQ